jgi:membrane-associated phospholipid phosphatase
VAQRTKWCILTAVIAAAVYAILWTAVALHWKWLHTIDSAVLDPLHSYGMKRPGWVRFWNALTIVFGPDGFQIIGAAVVVVALLRRNLRAVLFVLATMELNGVVAQLAKNLAGRPRPPGALTAGPAASFPSGHAVATMAGVLALLTISADMFPRLGRTVPIAVGAVLVIAIGTAKVILNAHYPSDVVAGWALGYLWYLVCLVVIRPGKRDADAASQLDPYPP